MARTVKISTLTAKRILFNSLDYSLNDTILGRQLGYTSKAVWYWRHKLGRQKLPAGRTRKSLNQLP